MIISRKGFKDAFLVFAANGEIRLNKKTIGLWRRSVRRKFTEDYAYYQEVKTTFRACVQFRDNKRHDIMDKNKYHLMLQVAKSVPDDILTRLPNA